MAPLLLLVLGGLALWLALRSGGGEDDTVATPRADEPSASGEAFLRGRRGAPSDEGLGASPSGMSLPPTTGWETTGRVVDWTTEQGVPDVTVRVALEQGEVIEVIAVATTDEQGHFHVALPVLDALSSAELTVAQLRYRIVAEGYWDRARGTTTVGRLDRLQEVRRATVSLRVEPGDTLYIRVVDVAGGPVSGAKLSVDWVVDENSRRTLGDGGPPPTDPAGESEYQILPGYPAVYVSAWLHGVGEGSLMVPLSPGGGSLRLPPIVLEGPGRITGRAVFPDGAPAAGVDVYCRLNDGTPVRPGNSWASARTDDLGRFVLSGLWQARGHLGLSLPRGRHGLLYVPEIPVATGDHGVVFEVPLPRVRLHVADPEGARMVHASYRVQLEGYGPARTYGGDISASDGTASLWGRPGDRVLVLVHGWAVRPVEAVVDLPAGVWTRDLDLTVRAWDPTSFGRVRFEVEHEGDGEVGPLIPVLLTPLMRRPVPNFFRQPDGTNQEWSAGDAPLPAPPGRWLLQIRSTRERAERWLSHVGEIEIRPGEETVFRATVQQGARLTMRLEPPGGRDPDLHWWARLTPDDGLDQPIDKESGPRRTYSWRLRAGGWTLRLDADGYEPISRHVTLAGEEQHEIVLSLVPQAR